MDLDLFDADSACDFDDEDEADEGAGSGEEIPPTAADEELKTGEE